MPAKRSGGRNVGIWLSDEALTWLDAAKDARGWSRSAVIERLIERAKMADAKPSDQGKRPPDSPSPATSRRNLVEPRFRGSPKPA
jgi:hypothetical protein